MNFHYNKEEAYLLSELSFILSARDRMVIKGESGTGKTTLFRLLLGFEQPDNGEIRFRDNPLDPATIKQLRRETAWLPQDLDLGNGTPEQIFRFLLEFETNISRRPGKKDSIISVLQSLGLNHEVWKTNFSDLSTGQRQRTGIMFCHLLTKPLVLLDEPTSALDQESKQKVIDLLFADSRKTILSASHDPFWINQCDKIVELT